MLKVLRTYIEQKKEQYRQQQLSKFFKVKSWLVRFYEEKNQQDETATIPAFMQAEQKIKEIKSNRQLDFWYSRLKKHNLAA